MRIAATTLFSLTLWIPANAAEVVVTMQGNKYLPSTIAARAGDSLRFVNADGYPHRVVIGGVDLGTQ